jgi:trehalose 6-phosphate synthase
MIEDWTKERLQNLVTERLRGVKLIVVSNREPYIHSNQNGQTVCGVAASGLTTALDPILKASGGVWVAHGSGSADRDVADDRGRVPVPPEAPSYTLRRVWLSKRIEDEYYYGLANEGLWPLCHAAFHKPRFREGDWASYKEANMLFADAVLDEANGEPALVFIQDYHLALLPGMLKKNNSQLVVAQFWHIPWPNRETFRAFPWKTELLQGLLANDLLGFHLQYHCMNFLETIERSIEACVDHEHGSVTRSGHLTTVAAFPISIDFQERALRARSVGLAAAAPQWRGELGGTPEILGIGIDRIDYTKGIPERLEAIERLLQEHPEYVGRLVFLQVGVPSRTAIVAYDDLNQALVRQVDAINKKWARGSWRPIVLVRRHVDQQALTALEVMADFCLVTSLHDGMNLVAKEFVASRIDGDGVLILSAFTGAARELTDALIVNPFSIGEVADAIHRAVNMPAEERRRRMNRMRGVVAENNVYRWAGRILQNLSGIEASGAVHRQPTMEDLVLAQAAR